MAVKLKELKEAKDRIAAAFNISASDAARVVGYYNGGFTRDEGKLCAILEGDQTEINKVINDLHIETQARANFKNTKIPAGDIKKAEGEVVTNNNELPEGFGDRCCEWIEDFCNKHNLDITRLKSQQWRSACMYIGEHIKQSDVIRDKERERTQGGRIYSGEKLEKLLYLWAYLCGIYNQVPLVSDFINFSGCHPNYFYDYDRRGLSSSSVEIVKKARAIEESGLGSSVAGGGAGAVGGMFLLKTRHGYSETVTVQHTTTTAAIGVQDLPKLEDLNG